MQILEYMEAQGHEQLAVWTDPASGLRAFIAIHDTTLGPALGGTRIWPHPTEHAALEDVLRLSRAMTYKSALAELPFGGGKGLIMADARTDKTEAMMRSYGRFVESLAGRYVTTEDVGASTQDIEWIALETKHVLGLDVSHGGSGNPATMTGFGIFQGMRACAEARWGTDSLDGKTVAIQGFGNVATALAGHLTKAGAKLIVTDIDEAKRSQAGELRTATVVAPSEIFGVECDILSPCALGAVLNEKSIPQLRCEVVCGAANNQLKEAADADRLRERGILYAPDYVVNAGGVINLSYERGGAYDAAAALAKTARIHDTVAQVITIATQQGISTAAAADAMAEERIAAVRSVRRRNHA